MHTKFNKMLHVVAVVHNIVQALLDIMFMTFLICNYMCGSRNFRQGGPGQSDKKKALTFFFFFFFFFFVFFFSPQLILQKSNGQFQRNLSFFKGSRGGPTFSRGVQLFPGGGVQLLIPYRNL